MAITIETTPQDYGPVYNPLIVVASSTNSGQTDFSYIFEICDSSGTTLRTLRIPPEILYAYGVLDVARVLESYVNEDGATDFFKTQTIADTLDCFNSYYQYTIKIGEEYDIAGTLTQFLDLANTTKFTFNGGILFEDFINWDHTDYELDANTKRFLTDDIDKPTLLSQEGYTHYLGAKQPSGFRIKTYQEDGTLIDTYEFANALTSEFSSFASAPTSLNNVTLTTGTQPVIDSDVSYYEIHSLALTTQTSRVYTYKIKEDCGEGAVLHFKNDLGGFDWFPFITFKESYDIKREEYKQNPQRLQSDGTYVFNTLDRERIQYHTKRTRKAKLNTDFLTDAEWVWLRQLVDSPEVYLELDGTFYSVLLTANNYQEKEENHDGFTFLEVNIEFSIEEYRQRY